MIELWYVILAFTLTTYLVLDGRNFGVGILHCTVARTPAERRQVIAAIGPLWSWDEVWLLATGGILFVAFPKYLAAALSGYYLAIFLVLWCLILRGIALEIGGHMENALWQTFWDIVLTISSFLLAVLFGVALGNVVRGAPLDGSGVFHLALFTNLGVRGAVGLLDWYTVSMGLLTLVIYSALGATYLVVKTEGEIRARSEQFARRLWWAAGAGAAVIFVETWFVRPAFFEHFVHHPLAYVALASVLGGLAALVTGWRGGKEQRVFLGSCLLTGGFLVGGAAAIFPELMHSTAGAETSMTVYNSAAGRESLTVGVIWWPVATVLSFIYFGFILRHYRGKVKVSTDTQGNY